MAGSVRGPRQTDIHGLQLPFCSPNDIRNENKMVNFVLDERGAGDRFSVYVLFRFS